MVVQTTRVATTPKTDARAFALEKLLAEYARVAIVGGPRTGKTTLVALVEDRVVIHTDDWRAYPWAEVPALIIARAKLATGPKPSEVTVAFSMKGGFVIEGTQVARALRAGLEVDAVLYLDETRAEQSKNQAAMSKSVATVFAEWRALHPNVHVVSPDLHS